MTTSYARIFVISVIINKIHTRKTYSIREPYGRTQGESYATQFFTIRDARFLLFGLFGLSDCLNIIIFECFYFNFITFLCCFMERMPIILEDDKNVHIDVGRLFIVFSY